jgi:hypothetical protein
MKNFFVTGEGADKAKYFEYQRRITANVRGINTALIKVMRLDGTVVRKKESTSKRTSRSDFPPLKNKELTKVN